MKSLALAIASTGLLAAAGTAQATTTLLFEDFEDATVGYTTSVAEFTDGSGDFFIRTDGSDHGAFVSYTGVQGSSYFAGMDLDGEGATLPLTLDFSGININGFANLEFSSLIAEDDDGTNEDWDVADFVHIDYRIDNGGYQNLLWFESIPDGDSFNAVPAVDTDFDGDGDGTQLTDTFSLFTAAIAGTGNLLDLRITFDLDSGDEDIAFDNITVTGTGAQTVVPLPAAAWLLGLGLAGYLGLGRARKSAA